MITFSRSILAVALALFLSLTQAARAQQPDRFGPPDDQGGGFGPPGGQGGPDDFGPPGGFLRLFPLMAVLDTNEDGQISTKEMKRAAAALRTLDKDENGTLTEDELRPEMPHFVAGGPRGQGDQRFGVGPPGPESFVNRAMQFDEDQDGKLSREELTRFASQMIRRSRQGGPSKGGPQNRGPQNGGPPSGRLQNDDLPGDADSTEPQ